MTEKKCYECKKYDISYSCLFCENRFCENCKDYYIYETFLFFKYCKICKLKYFL